MARYEDDFRAARGIRVGEAKIHGERVRRITTEGKDRARVVWSLLDPDKLFIRERRGEGDDTYDAFYPTTFWDRLRLDGWRQAWLWIVAVLVAPWLAFVVAARLNLVPGLGFGPAVALGLTAVPVLIVLLLPRVLREAELLVKALDLETLQLRLALGLAVSFMWAVGASWPSPVDVLGAVWIFTAANVVWIATVGYDRYRHAEFVDRVGGPVSMEEAERLLGMWKRDGRRGPS